MQATSSAVPKRFIGVSATNAAIFLIPVRPVPKHWLPTSGLELPPGE